MMWRVKAHILQTYFICYLKIQIILFSLLTPKQRIEDGTRFWVDMVMEFCEN